MVKFKKYTEEQFKEFLEKHTIEDDFSQLFEFIKDSDANLRFDDNKGILTVKVVLGFSGDKELQEDNSWN